MNRKLYSILRSFATMVLLCSFCFPSYTLALLDSSPKCSLVLDVVLLKQKDTQWKNIKMLPSSDTVGDSGCALTCLAMFETYRTGILETPKSLIESDKATFGSSGNLSWTCPVYKPFVGESFSLERIYELLHEGRPVMAGVNNGKHFVLIYGYTGLNKEQLVAQKLTFSSSDFLIRDPGYSKASLGEYSSFSRISYHPGQYDKKAVSSCPNHNTTTATYTIAFNANGGYNAPNERICDVGNKVQLPSDQPSKSSATFLGWATSPTALSAKYASGKTYSISAKQNSTITLYAVWQDTVTATPRITPTPKAEGVAESHTCGYGKDGFCKKCGSEYVCKETPVNATYVTAKNEVAIWSRPYSNNSTRIDESLGICLAKGSSLNVSTKVVNHLGNIWYRISGGQFDGCYVYSENVQLAEQETPVSTVAPQSPAPEAPTIPSDMPRIESGTYYITVPANIKLRLYRAYTDTTSFTYISAKSSSYQIRATQKATKQNGETWYFFRTGDNKDVWFLFQQGMTIPTPKPSKVTLSYDAAGGKWSVSSYSGDAGDSFQIPYNLPSKNGYRFVGWTFNANASAANYSELYQPGATVVINADCTLFAVWEQNPAEPTASVSPPQSAEPGLPEGELPVQEDALTPVMAEGLPAQEDTPAPAVEEAPASVEAIQPQAQSPVEQLSLAVPHYYAADPRWSGLTLGNSSYTVGQSGGFITCMAMYESYRLGYEETPATLINSGRAQFSGTGGLLFKCDLYDPYKGADFSTQTVYDLLKQNKPVIVWANNGGKDYAVICYEFVGDPANMKKADFHVHDPMNGTMSLDEWNAFGRLCYYPK